MNIAEQDAMIETMDALQYRYEQEERHRMVIHASDVEELRRSLWEAAQRMLDVASLLERNPTYDAAGFLRAGAKRYHRASGIADPLGG